jgi:hypothetical protein
MQVTRSPVWNLSFAYFCEFGAVRNRLFTVCLKHLDVEIELVLDPVDEVDDASVDCTFIWKGVDLVIVAVGVHKVWNVSVNVVCCIKGDKVKMDFLERVSRRVWSPS